jgi:hypothetical protein
MSKIKHIGIIGSGATEEAIRLALQKSESNVIIVESPLPAAEHTGTASDIIFPVKNYVDVSPAIVKDGKQLRRERRKKNRKK